MKKITLVVLMVLCVTSHSWAQLAQTVEISSSPNPVGSGARALGMGGAFIGVADDATAASWNPAGLIQLETPEMSIVGAYTRRTEDTTYAAFPEASGPQRVDLPDLNYLSLAYPFNAGGMNMIVSLNLQDFYDFDKKVQLTYDQADMTVPVFLLENSVDYSQEGRFKAISPAFAVQVTPSVSLGFTLNFWDTGLYDNYWESSYNGRGRGTFAGFPFKVKTGIRQRYEMQGLKMDLLDPFHWENLNFHAGFMWNINSRFTLGGVFKSPFEAGLMHNYRFDSEIRFPTVPAADSKNTVEFAETVTLSMPMSYGLGLAFRYSDALSFAFDLYRTQWSDYILKDGQGNALNPITGKPASQSGIKDTLQVRLGGEYLFILDRAVIPLRAGVFYDPEPAEGGRDDFWGISLGSGIAYGKTAFDLAYVYRFGRDVRTVTVGDFDSAQDVDQHMLYISVVYHF
jgi:long-subunit fatty acid transport protein